MAIVVFFFFSSFYLVCFFLFPFSFFFFFPQKRVSSFCFCIDTVCNLLGIFEFGGKLKQHIYIIIILMFLVYIVSTYSLA